MERYLDGLKAGRSFVTNGPLLQFRVADRQPGDVLATPAGADLAWQLDVASAVPFARVEILVNGEVVWSGDGLQQPGSRTYRGTGPAPAGGWIAARVHGGSMAWPGMDSYPFAHTAPLWVGTAGSVDPAAGARAAKDLLAALDVAEERIARSYEGVETPALLGRIARARAKLRGMLQ
jgi:TolB protein